MSTSKKGPIVDQGMCRCCGVPKRCRLINYEYDYLGKLEVYSDMLVDCFGLVLSHLDGEESERLICATCVVRLRDASHFRQQVLSCEQRLLNATVHIHEAGEDSLFKVKVEVKQETPQSDSMEHDNVMSNDQGVDHDSDDHADIAGNDDMYDETQTDIKQETTPVTPSSGIRTRLRSKPTGVVKSIKLDTYSETEIEIKIQRMKEKLDRKIQKAPSAKPQKVEINLPKQKRPPIQDKELNTIKNTLTIIEYSYVTPFIALFSDYHCVYCREMFLDPDKLREHTLEHDPRTYQEFLTSKKLPLVDILRIDCRLCQTHIDNIDVFKEHITNVHKKVIYKDVDNEFMKFKLTSGKIQCLECGKTFSFFQALRKHMAEHFGTYICDVCGAHYFEERHLVFHKNTHDVNRTMEVYTCNECGKTFKSKNSKKFHITRIHRNEPAYPCNKCEEIFISYHMRYRHKMAVHGEKREFPCENCGKVYVCRKTLREHYQRTHLQLLRHECGQCGKKFYLPSHLRDHMTTHTGERNYRCDYCGKNYPRKKALKVHLLSHNTEKKYKCNLCPSAYTQANNYKNHMKTKHPMPNEFNVEYR